jgi:predicted DNA binding protein
MRLATLVVKIPGNWIGGLSTSCDLSVKVLKCTPRSKSGGQSYLQIDTNPEMSQDTLVQRIRSIEPKCNIQLTSVGPGRHIGTIELDTCTACKLIAESGCFIDSASSREDGAIQWNIIAPNAPALSEMVRKIRHLGCSVSIEKISTLRTASELTIAQERVLEIAYNLGYFDIPRRTNLSALSKRLEVSKSTLNVMIRRAQRKIIASHLKKIA